MQAMMVENLKFKPYEIKKIGIFRALYLGDMLCIIPAVRAIRLTYPDASITLIGLPWQRDFVKRFSAYFDHFMEFPGWPGLPEQEPDAKKIVQFVQKARAEKFDLLLQMQGNGFITNSMCLLWGARHLAGLRREKDHCANEDLFPVSQDSDHEVLRFLKITDALGIKRCGSGLEFPFTTAEAAMSERVIDSLGLIQKPYVCLHAGARDERRRWAPENFAFIADKLYELGYTIVLTGSIQEKALLTSIQELTECPVVNMVAQLGVPGIGELAILIDQSLCLISNDTGVSHIAAALHVPSTVIFSPYSDVNRWAPLNRDLHQVIPHQNADDAEYVLYRILDHLKKQSSTKSPVLLD